jgi:serine/threonine protein kinase
VPRPLAGGGAPVAMAAQAPELAPLVPDAVVGGRYVVLQQLPPAEERFASATYVVEDDQAREERILRRIPIGGERLVRAALAGPTIGSERVVAALDAGLDGEGVPYVVEEFARREGLARALAGGAAFPFEHFEAVLAQLAAVVDAAHGAAVVHGAIRPEVVWLERRTNPPPPPGWQEAPPPPAPLVFVSDFGFGAVIAGERVQAGQAEAIAWTAPELLEAGGFVSPRADVWSIGLLAFRMLTGRPYWRATSAGALAVEILAEPPAPASARARELGYEGPIPPWFDEWFARCVARDPAGRFARAGEARGALPIASAPPTPPQAPQRILMGNPKGSRYVNPLPPGGEDGPTGGPVVMGNPKGARYADPPRRSAWPVVIAALGAVLAGVAAYVFLLRRG